MIYMMIGLVLVVLSILISLGIQMYQIHLSLKKDEDELP